LCATGFALALFVGLAVTIVVFAVTKVFVFDNGLDSALTVAPFSIDTAFEALFAFADIAAAQLVFVVDTLATFVHFTVTVVVFAVTDLFDGPDLSSTG
jgi:hypothetical protein